MQVSNAFTISNSTVNFKLSIVVDLRSVVMGTVSALRAVAALADSDSYREALRESVEA